MASIRCWPTGTGLRFRAGRPWPGCPGNAGSNTAADHVRVLDMALAVLPPRARPRPGDPACASVLIRTDAAGATHLFAAAVRERGCSFSLGFAIDEQVQDAVLRVPARARTPAYDIDGQPRDGAQVAEITGCVNPGRLAGRIAADHPPGTAAPRRAAAVHRYQRAPVHRVPHRHPRRPVRRPGSPAPVPRPGRGPHPRPEGNRPAEPAVRGYEQNKAWLELHWPPLTCPPGRRPCASPATSPAASRRRSATASPTSPPA